MSIGRPGSATSPASSPASSPRDLGDASQLNELARFWLDRHVLFRELDGLIRSGTENALDAKLTLGRNLTLHLDDEEDLVIPLIIEKG